jgi:hypothetical protein
MLLASSDDDNNNNVMVSSLWIPGMDSELQANIQDEMAQIAREMRKRYCQRYTQKVNTLMRKYF